jgi:hypothetical protein
MLLDFEGLAKVEESEDALDPGRLESIGTGSSEGPGLAKDINENYMDVRVRLRGGTR